MAWEVCLSFWWFFFVVDVGEVVFWRVGVHLSGYIRRFCLIAGWHTFVELFHMHLKFLSEQSWPCRASMHVMHVTIMITMPP